jgi:PAS domain S-box-containing protein
MPERIRQLAEQVRFPLHRLTFEITEGGRIDNFDLARAVLGDLKSLGIRLALDDFGTGYSGLQHLQMLPFDTLKLDSSFVRTMTSHRESRRIVAAVMGLCQNLGLTPIAEGVETQIQSDMLLGLGYRMGQGWLFGRPAPLPETAELLQQDRQKPQTLSIAHIAEQAALRLEAMPIQCLWQLRALYAGAPVGLAFVDPGFRYVAVNERLAEMHGVPIAALLGRAIADVIPEVFAQIEPRLRRALAGEPITDARTYYHSQDRVRVVQASYQPVRDFVDEVIGVSVAVVDITDCAGDHKSRNVEFFGQLERND